MDETPIEETTVETPETDTEAGSPVVAVVATVAGLAAAGAASYFAAKYVSRRVTMWYAKKQGIIPKDWTDEDQV